MRVRSYFFDLKFRSDVNVLGEVLEAYWEMEGTSMAINYGK